MDRTIREVIIPEEAKEFAARVATGDPYEVADYIRNKMATLVDDEAIKAFQQLLKITGMQSLGVSKTYRNREVA